MAERRDKHKADIHDLDHIRSTPHMWATVFIGMILLIALALGLDALGWV